MNLKRGLRKPTKIFLAVLFVLLFFGVGISYAQEMDSEENKKTTISAEKSTYDECVPGTDVCRANHDGGIAPECVPDYDRGDKEDYRCRVPTPLGGDCSSGTYCEEKGKCACQQQDPEDEFGDSWIYVLKGTKSSKGLNCNPDLPCAEGLICVDSTCFDKSFAESETGREKIYREEYDQLIKPYYASGDNRLNNTPSVPEFYKNFPIGLSPSKTTSGFVRLHNGAKFYDYDIKDKTPADSGDFYCGYKIADTKKMPGGGYIITCYAKRLKTAIDGIVEFPVVYHIVNDEKGFCTSHRYTMSDLGILQVRGFEEWRTCMRTPDTTQYGDKVSFPDDEYYSSRIIGNEVEFVFPKVFDGTLRFDKSTLKSFVENLKVDVYGGNYELSVDYRFLTTEEYAAYVGISRLLLWTVGPYGIKKAGEMDISIPQYALPFSYDDAEGSYSSALKHLETLEDGMKKGGPFQTGDSRDEDFRESTTRSVWAWGNTMVAHMKNISTYANKCTEILGLEKDNNMNYISLEWKACIAYYINEYVKPAADRKEFFDFFSISIPGDIEKKVKDLGMGQGKTAELITTQTINQQQAYQARQEIDVKTAEEAKRDAGPDSWVCQSETTLKSGFGFMDIFSNKSKSDGGKFYNGVMPGLTCFALNGIINATGKLRALVTPEKLGKVLNLYDMTKPGSMVVIMWVFLRDLINSIFIMTFMIMALINVVGPLLKLKILDDWRVQRKIPAIVGAIFLVNFSLAIANLIVSLSNALNNEFLNRIKDLGGDLGSVWDLNILFAVVFTIIIVAYSFLLLYYYAILWVRVIIVNVLMIFSAAPYIGRLLPVKQISDMTDKWMGLFTKWVFMGPMLCLFLYLTAFAITNSSNIGIEDPGIEKGLNTYLYEEHKYPSTFASLNLTTPNNKK